MPWTNIPRPNLSSDEERQLLRPRPWPYWNFMSYGRHLGYLKRRDRPTLWIARYRAKNGWYHQHQLGRVSLEGREAPWLDYEQARQAARAWFKTQSSALGDEWPVGQRVELNICPIGKICTIGHAVRDFIEWKRLTGAPSYLGTLISLANCHIIPRLAFLPAEDFNAEHLAAFVKDVLETPSRSGVKRQKAKRPIGQLSAQDLRRRKMTINNLIGILRMALRFAWESGKIDNSRAWMVLRRVPNVNLPRMLHLSRSECRSLIAHATPELRRLIFGALYTGCRASELLRMEVSHVGRDGYGVYISPSKGYRPRFVFLADEAMQFFLELGRGKRQNDLLFVRDSGRPWFGNYKPIYKKAVKDAGLPAEFVFHSLRHTYASQLVQAGAPLLVVSEQLGHVDPVHVMRTYGHLAPQIKESEVRQRFATIDEDTAVRAQRKGSILRKWRAEVLGPNWQTYAFIHSGRQASADC